MTTKETIDKDKQFGYIVQNEHMDIVDNTDKDSITGVTLSKIKVSSDQNTISSGSPEIKSNCPGNSKENIDKDKQFGCVVQNERMDIVDDPDKDSNTEITLSKIQVSSDVKCT